MRWRVHKLARWRELSTQKVEAKAERVRYAHKKCRTCRALNDADDKVCSNCGEPLGWRLTHMVQRAGLGGAATTSALLIVLILISYVAAMATTSGSLELRHLMIEYKAIYHLTEVDVWQRVAQPFVHLSLLGILSGCLVIFLLGQEIEEFYGRFAMLAWFVLTALVGAIAHSALFDAPLFGAQTGICGLIGVGLARGHRAGNHAGRELRSLMVKWAIGVFGALLLVQGNIAGDVIACAAGLLIGYKVAPGPVRLSAFAQRALGLLGLSLSSLGAALAIRTLGLSSLTSVL